MSLYFRWRLCWLFLWKTFSQQLLALCLFILQFALALKGMTFFFFFFFVSLFECMLIISHYIMQVPPALYDEQGRSINKGHVYISESSPPQVSQAYYKQFKEDFMLFLGSRSEELIVGGRMVLILLGRRGPDHVDRGNSFFWELLSRSFANLISKVINGILCTII